MTNVDKSVAREVLSTHQTFTTPFDHLLAKNNLDTRTRELQLVENVFFPSQTLNLFLSRL